MHTKIDNNEIVQNFTLILWRIGWIISLIYNKYQRAVYSKKFVSDFKFNGKSMTCERSVRHLLTLFCQDQFVSKKIEFDAVL